MSTSARILMAFCMLVSIIPPSMVMAANDAPEIQAGLMAFADRLGKLGSFEEFGLPIPLTSRTPGEIMGMDYFFEEVFTHINSDLSISPAPPFDLGNGAKINSLTISTSSAGSLMNVTVVLHATKTETLSISYSNTPEESLDTTESGTCLDFIDNDNDGLTDGEEPDCTPITIEGRQGLENVTFQLNTTFQFQYDANNPEFLENFYLINEPTITLTYLFDGAVKPFESRFGIADVDITGNALYNAQLEAQLLDENLDEKIRLWDMDNSILVDYVRMGYVNMSGDDVYVNLRLHSPLLDSANDGFLELKIPDLNFKPQPTATLEIPIGGALESFKTVGPDELLTGLASYAYALDTAWIVNEGELPYIAEKYHHLFMPGESLLTLVRRQGDALVLCGTEKTSPPSGTPDPDDETVQTVFCQAITAEEPSGDPEWRRSDSGPALVYDGDLKNTVGMNPTAWVVFEDVHGDNWKDFEVEFQYLIEGQAESHIAEPRIRTVGDLDKKIKGLSGVNPEDILFDDATRTLVFPITQNIDPPASSIHMAFGDLLLEDTGLSNIADNSDTTSKTMDLGTITVQAGFGSILEAGLEDRYFISTIDGSEITVSGLTASVPNATILPGSIGALGVDVRISSFAMTGGTPLTIDITPSGFADIAGAIGTRELIDDPVAPVTATSNLGANGILEVTSKGLTPPLTGVVTIIGANIQLNTGAEKLKAFNIDSENPQALINLILDGIYNRTSKMYNQAGDPLPVVGMSIRELAPQFKEVIDVVNVIKTGGSEADVYCDVVEDPDSKQIQVKCWAVSDISLTDESEVSWEISPSAITISDQPITDPNTIWPDPNTNGPKATFVISETATPTDLNQMSVTLTIDGTPIQFPYHPPETLEGLEEALEQKLSLDSDKGDKFDFIMNDSDDSLQIVLIKHKKEDRNFLLQLDLQDSSDGIYRLSAQKSVPPAKELLATIDTNFTLDFNLPLVSGVEMEDLSFNPVSPVATGASVAVGVSIDQDDFDLNASLGGMKLGLNANDPELELTAQTATTEYSSEGEKITIDYTITNTNDFTLSGPFSVVDVNNDMTVDCGGTPPDTLAPDGTVLCTAVFTVSAEDVLAQAITIKAYAAAGLGVISPTVDVVIPNTATMVLLVGSEYIEVESDKLIYTFHVINNIDADLSNVTVTNDKIADEDIHCDGASNVIASLTVDAETTCTAEYLITDEDVAAKEVKSITTASTTYDGNPETVTRVSTDAVSSSPALTLNASVESNTGMVGDVLNYTYQIVNTGNVTLSGPFAISDDKVAANCNEIPASLAPGGSTTCIGQYTITAGDLEVGEVVSNASASTYHGGNLIESELVETRVNVVIPYGLHIAYNSTLQYYGSIWDRTLIGDDLQIHLAVRTIQDADESFIGMLEYHHKIEVGEKTIPPVDVPMEMEEALEVAPLDPTLVSLSLPLLGGLLQDSLDGDRWGIRVPLAGSDLAAGENFEELLIGWADALDTELESLSASTPKDLHDAMQSAVESAFGTMGSSILVNVYCQGNVNCNTVTDPEEVVTRTEVSLTTSASVHTNQIPFASGLPGLALEVTDDEAVNSNIENWTLNLTFGLERFAGPYVAVNDSNDLDLMATLTIAEPTSDCAAPEVYNKVTENFTPSTERCMNGIIGLLPGKLYDGNGDSQSKAVVHTTFNLGDGSIPDGMLTYAELLDGLGANEGPVVTATDGNSDTAQINLLFVTNSSPIPLPQIAGTIHLTYDNGAYEVVYENIYMNATTFFGSFLGPLVEDVQKYTKPLQPVIDTVTAPIPVVSDLAEMVGAGSVSLLTVMQRLNNNDLKLLTKLANLITFINNIPADETGLWIGLGPGDEGSAEEEGSFTVNIEPVEELPCGEDFDDDDFSNECDSKKDKKDELIKDPPEKINKKGELTPDASLDWDGAGINLPFLEDTTQIYGMLLGVDATLIRVDLGTLKASAGLEYTYGPFMIGPIPVTLTIGGTVTFEGRFAIGYDTRGLHQALRGNSFTGAELLQGIYIDDLDLDGNDVPEIKLEVEVYAGAAVSIRIFEAGIRAGVLFGVELNWNDPNKDGKLRFEEISMWQWKPICLFDRRGYIGFYLKFYLKIDLFLFTAKIEWTPLQKTFDLFNESCAPPDPVLAQDGGNNRFRLNMGPNEDDRHIPSDGGNEKFIVRQLTPEGDGCQDSAADTCDAGTGTWISVTFLGIYREYLVPPGYHIYAEAGGGNDVISLLSGTDQREATRGEEVPFTLDAELDGGYGDDQIDSGAGNDFINGGPGNDTINARSGDDIVIGGPDDAVDDNDSLDGGIGIDILYGGPGIDVLNGGPGKDLLAGGNGDDNLAGGPGMPPNSEVEEIIKDFTDVLVGGEGNDIQEGSFDTDYLFGDTSFPDLPLSSDFSMGTDRGAVVQTAIDNAASMNCQSILGGDGDDNLIGGDGDDYLYGGGGNDRMEGEKGNDTMCGNDGHDTLTGGKGADWLYGNAGHDWLQGDQGDDHLYGGTNDDDLLGGEGSDTLYGNEDNDILIGDMGSMEGHPEDCEEEEEDICIPVDHPDDTSQAPEFVIPVTEPPAVSDISYADTMHGGSGNDFMFGEYDIDHMYGDAGDDYMEGNAGDDIMDGGTGSDHMLGGQDADTMNGGTEDDFMWGNSGDDEMYGDNDNDTMHGNTGDDYMEGNAGTDILYGGTDQDDIIGGSGIAGSPDTGDTLFGNEGDDRIAGDNALITASKVTLLDVEILPGGIDPAWYGADWIEGNDGNDQLWGQGGADQILGGNGDDYIEGNHDSDLLYGEAGDDDILGGSSPVYSGLTNVNYTDQSTKTRLVPLSTQISVEVPLNDIIHGGDGSDVILGDNGIIARTSGNILQSYQLEIDTFGNTSPRHITNGSGRRVMRTVTMINATTGFTAGSDLIYGESGEDELYGQFDDTGQTDPAIGDELYGDGGQDLLIGDQGTAITRVQTNDTQTIKTNAPFLDDVILLKGTLHWEVDLSQSDDDGNDRLSGGDGADFLHGNGGSDVLNGNAGNDRIFGDDGNDAIWGGTDHDHLWGGAGDDYLDVLPRASRAIKKGNKTTVIPADPKEWASWTTISDYLGIDYMYGGIGQDAMQADQAPTGPAPGDRLVDWIGVYNIYYLCGPQYGEYVITRSPSPSVKDFLVQLAAGDGALDPGSAGSSGYAEIAIVYQPDYKTNSHPPHPDTPGHFTCP